MKRLLDYDPLTGIRTFHEFDSETNETTISTFQDIGPYLEANKDLYNDEDYKRKGIKNEWWHVASIPITVQEKWLREKGVDVYNKNHLPAVKRLLNDPDWRYLRTAAGKL